MKTEAEVALSTSALSVSTVTKLPALFSTGNVAVESLFAALDVPHKSKLQMSFGFPNNNPTCPRQCFWIISLSLVGKSTSTCASSLGGPRSTCIKKSFLTPSRSLDRLCSAILPFQETSGKLKSPLRTMACNTETSSSPLPHPD